MVKTDDFKKRIKVKKINDAGTRFRTPVGTKPIGIFKS